jgi:hypothetical protein
MHTKSTISCESRPRAHGPYSRGEPTAVRLGRGLCRLEPTRFMYFMAPSRPSTRGDQAVMPTPRGRLHTAGKGNRGGRGLVELSMGPCLMAPWGCPLHVNPVQGSGVGGASPSPWKTCSSGAAGRLHPAATSAFRTRAWTAGQS